jgi:hypothetical protein
MFLNHLMIGQPKKDGSFQIDELMTNNNGISYQ